MHLPDLAKGRETLKEELQIASLFATPTGKLVLARWRETRPCLVDEIETAISRCRRLWKTGAA